MIKANFPHQEWGNSPSTWTASSARSGCLAIQLSLAVSPLSSGTETVAHPHSPLNKAFVSSVWIPSMPLTQTPRTKAMLAETCPQAGVPHFSECIRSKQENPSSILLMYCNFLSWGKMCIHGPTKNVCMLPTYSLMTTLNVCNILDKRNIDYKQTKTTS